MNAVKFLVTLLITWATILIFCSALDLFENPIQHIFSPFIIALIITIGFFSRNPKQQPEKQNTKIQTTVPTLSVCHPLNSKVLYEVKQNKVYKPFSSKPIYEVKDNKVYRPLDSKPVFIISANKLYKPSETTPTYRIEGNKVYKGHLGNKPVFSLQWDKAKH